MPPKTIISRSNELQLTLSESNAGVVESVNVTYEGNVIFREGLPQEAWQPKILRIRKLLYFQLAFNEF